MKNAELQAFPCAIHGDEKAGWKPEYVPGLTKREYFAAMIMPGIATANLSNDYVSNPSAWAKMSVEMADALLLELEKPV